MASRRSRLKAVANLPLRRKPLAADQNKEATKLEDDGDGKSALKVEGKEADNNNSTDNAKKELCENGDTSISSSAELSSTPDAPINSQNENQEDRTNTEVPSTDSLECKPGKSSNNSGTGMGLRFGRRIKPSVSLTVLKERPQRTAQTSASEVDSSGKENQLIAHDTGSCINSPSNAGCSSNNLDTQSSDQEHSNEIASNTVQNSNNILTESLNVNVSTETSEQDKGVSMTQCNLNQTGDTYQKIADKPISCNLKSPTTGAKEIVSTDVLNSSIKPIQEVNQRQSSEVSSQSNKSSSDVFISHSQSLSSSQLQCVSTAPKRNASTVKQKKSKLSDYTRKVADARREFQRKYEKIPPDRSSLRMIDLIFYNPSTNPMESKTKSDRTESIQEDRVDDPDPVDKSPLGNANTVVDDDMENDDFGKMPVPQVKIGMNGEIILDEKSLVIETTDAKKGREDLQNSVPVFEDRSSKTCYYKRKTQKSRDWSDSETKRFYKALNTIGTDFSLMQKYFPLRSRLELKNKFKREEKLNRNLIDQALNNPSEFDITQFEKYLALEKQAEEEEAAMKMQRKIKPKRNTNRARSKSSLLARELAGSDEDNDLLLGSSTNDQESMKLKEKTKKSNDIDLLCERYALKGGEIKDAGQPQPPPTVDEERVKWGASESKVFSEYCANECGNGAKIRDAFDEVQSASHIDESDRTRQEGCGGGETDESKERDSGHVDVVDEFYDAVVNLSAALKSGASNSNGKKPVRAPRRGKVNVGKCEKRKLPMETGRKEKKPKSLPYVSTLDIEMYDSRHGDSNSSSNESNENGFTSTKTITDQDFMKLLAANAKNMKESKIQLQITEDYSSEKKVEIILDNVPSITLNEIQDQNVRIIASAETEGAEGLGIPPEGENELYEPQGQETSVIVKNPNAIIRMNSCESGSILCRDQDCTLLKNQVGANGHETGSAVSEVATNQSGPEKGADNEMAENENVILVINESDGSVMKNFEYMMVDGQDLEVSLDLGNNPDKSVKTTGKVLELVGGNDGTSTSANTSLGEIDDLKAGSLPAGSFVLMSTEPQKPLEERKFSVFMISEKSQADGTSLLSSVPVVLPPELLPSLVKEL